MLNTCISRFIPFYHSSVNMTNYMKFCLTKVPSSMLREVQAHRPYFLPLRCSRARASFAGCSWTRAKTSRRRRVSFRRVDGRYIRATTRRLLFTTTRNRQTRARVLVASEPVFGPAAIITYCPSRQEKKASKPVEIIITGVCSMHRCHLRYSGV